MKCFLQVLSEKIFSYSEGETAKNMTGSQASLDNSVFYYHHDTDLAILVPCKGSLIWELPAQAFSSIICGSFAITEFIFPISFSRKTSKLLFLPLSSQGIPEMGNAAIYSIVSSAGEEMSEKVLLERQIVLRSCIRSV